MMVFTVSFISLRLVIFFDDPRTFLSYVAFFYDFTLRGLS
jgi:hypothetical protein